VTVVLFKILFKKYFNYTIQITFVNKIQNTSNVFKKYVFQLLVFQLPYNTDGKGIQTVKKLLPQQAPGALPQGTRSNLQ